MAVEIQRQALGRRVEARNADPESAMVQRHDNANAGQAASTEAARAVATAIPGRRAVKPSSTFWSQRYLVGFRHLMRATLEYGLEA